MKKVYRSQPQRVRAPLSMQQLHSFPQVAHMRVKTTTILVLALQFVARVRQTNGDCGTHHPTTQIRQESTRAQDALRTQKDYASLIHFDPNGVWTRHRRGWFGPSTQDLKGTLEVQRGYVMSAVE